MHLNDIVNSVNNKLAGELFTFGEIKIHLDAVIDEINSKLDSTFPSFTEFQKNYTGEPNYNFFPDKYIRSVVIPGAAFYFYITDEEGAETAPAYLMEYQKNLFFMERDYLNQVPEAFQASGQGYLDTPAQYGVARFYTEMF